MPLTHEESEFLAHLYVDAYYLWHPQQSLDQVPHILEIAHRHLASGQDLVKAEANLKNVSDFLLLIISKSKLLGQNSIRMTRLSWFKGLEQELPEISKVAAFMANVARSFSEDPDITSKVITSVIQANPETVWDAFCSFPIFIV